MGQARSIVASAVGVGIGVGVGSREQEIGDCNIRLKSDQDVHSTVTGT